MKNIIVTGCSRGIGLELVKLLCKDKNNFVLGVSRDGDALHKLEKEISNFKSFKADISEINKSATELENILQEFGSIDVLINNSGSLINKSFADISSEEAQYLFQVNFFGAAQLIQLCLPYFNASQRSHVVNIGSMGGYQGSAKFAGLQYYSASKAALASLTECLAVEYKDRNISFNCLALGAADTEMLRAAFPGYQAPVSASKMAAFIAYFAVNAQEHFNGKVIPVAGGNP